MEGQAKRLLFVRGGGRACPPFTTPKKLFLLYGKSLFMRTLFFVKTKASFTSVLILLFNFKSVLQYQSNARKRNNLYSYVQELVVYVVTPCD